MGLRAIHRKIDYIQNEIRASHNARDALLVYFSLLSVYYYNNGTIPIEQFNTKLIQCFNTKEAFINFNNTAKTHVIAGITQLSLTETFRKMKADIVGIGIKDIGIAIELLNKKLRQYRIRCQYIPNKNTLLIKTQIQSSSLRLQNWENMWQLSSLVSNQIVYTLHFSNILIESEYYTQLKIIAA